MRILADANISRAVVDQLRNASHDVIWANDGAPGVSDVEHFRTAISESRVILTEDKDFAELASTLTDAEPPPVILVRLDPLGYDARVARTVSSIDEIGNPLAGMIYTNLH